MDKRERAWISQIQEGDKQAFRAVFEQYYLDLCGFAADYLNSVDRARDVVQDVFLKVWDRRGELEVHTSLKSYLFQAVRNRALNEVRRSRTASEYREDLNRDGVTHRSAEDTYHMRELSKEVQKAIAELPDRRRMAFLMHRRHDFTYKEIGQIMEISPKTVENHIGRALKFLRDRLADKFPKELE